MPGVVVCGAGFVKFWQDKTTIQVTSLRNIRGAACGLAITGWCLGDGQFPCLDTGVGALYRLQHSAAATFAALASQSNV